MRLTTLDHCPAGVRLAKSIYNERGSVLLAEGTELTAPLLSALKRYSIFTIYIEDEASEGIEIVEAIPEELRNEAINVVTDGLNTIADLRITNIQGMIKTEKAIQSFKKIFKEILACLKDNQTVLNLLATTKIHDNYLYNHCVNVTIYSCQLAIENSLPIKNIEEIGLGAMLHDLGKLYIPPQILNKPGQLTNEEFDIVKKHSQAGFDILRKVHGIPIPVAHCAYQHHERLDGLGYPRGLKDNDIHKYSKILSVADVFDAVTSHRVYRPAMLPHTGLELLYAGSGTQFESRQVELFKGCIAIYPQGLTVKLNDGRTGIVTNYNFNAAGRPQVRIIRNEENQPIKAMYEIDLSANDHLTLHIVEADTLL